MPPRPEAPSAQPHEYFCGYTVNRKPLLASNSEMKGLSKKEKGLMDMDNGVVIVGGGVGGG